MLELGKEVFLIYRVVMRFAIREGEPLPGEAASDSTDYITSTELTYYRHHQIRFTLHTYLTQVSVLILAILTVMVAVTEVPQGDTTLLTPTIYLQIGTVQRIHCKQGSNTL